MRCCPIRRSGRFTIGMVRRGWGAADLIRGSTLQFLKSFKIFSAIFLELTMCWAAGGVAGDEGRADSAGRICVTT